MRKLHPELRSYWFEKLKDNGFFRLAIKNGDARVIFTLACEASVGWRETSSNKGRFIELVQKTVDGRAEREPYCMCGIQSALAFAEELTGKSSPVFSSEHCMTVWRKTSIKQRVSVSPLRGAIAIWNLEGTDSGHTGCVLENAQVYFRAIEFNTGGGIGLDNKIERNGDGVYYTKRDRIKTGNLRVVGFLKPF